MSDPARPDIPAATKDCGCGPLEPCKPHLGAGDLQDWEGRARAAEAKLDALREACRRKAEWVDLYCPPLGGSAEPLVKVSEILAVIGSGGASVFSAACTGPDCGERFADSETGEYEFTSRERMNRLLDADGWQADPVLCPACQEESRG